MAKWTEIFLWWGFPKSLVSGRDCLLQWNLASTRSLAIASLAGLVTSLIYSGGFCYRNKSEIFRRKIISGAIFEQLMTTFPHSVIATLFGVCTSLGLGTMQINRGLHLLNSSIPVGTGGIFFSHPCICTQQPFIVADSQLIIIWVITAVATGSVLTGISNGWLD